jgi:hypothetical protein
MSDDTERRLHDQLYALGTIEPSRGLADAALREAKQRRRRGATVIAAVAAAIIAIAVPLSVRHNSLGPATPPAGPAQRNVVVADQIVTFTKKTELSSWMVLDPKSGKYVEPMLPAAVQPGRLSPVWSSRRTVSITPPRMASMSSLWRTPSAAVMPG